MGFLLDKVQSFSNKLLEQNVFNSNYLVLLAEALLKTLVVFGNSMH